MVGTRKLAVLFLLSMLLFSFVVPTVAAEPAGPFKLVEALGQRVGEMGTFSFLFGDSDKPTSATDARGLGGSFWGFIRVLYIGLAFALFYGALSVIPGLGQMQNVTIPIAGILALIVGIATPASLLGAVAGTYSTLFIFILLGAPVAGVSFLVIGTPTNNAAVAAIKGAVCFLLLFVLVSIHQYMNGFF